MNSLHKQRKRRVRCHKCIYFKRGTLPSKSSFLCSLGLFKGRYLSLWDLEGIPLRYCNHYKKLKGSAKNLVVFSESVGKDDFIVVSTKRLEIEPASIEPLPDRPCFYCGKKDKGAFISTPEDEEVLHFKCFMEINRKMTTLLIEVGKWKRDKQ